MVLVSPGAVSRRSAGRPAVVAVSVAAVALAVRLTVSLRGGGLFGVHHYDEGVYFAAASALTAGRLPYRDFLLLHPPGVVLALAPFAGLGRLTHDALGLAVARVAWMCIGATNAALVSVLARRFGPTAALVAGLTYAVWPPAVWAEVLPRLEPLVSLLVLGAWVLLSSRRTTASARLQVVAGAAAGLAPTVKIWAVVPVAVLLLWFLWPGRRLSGAAARRVVVGVVGAAVAACLPFFAGAPAAMFRMVVLDQLERSEAGPPALRRWPSILGAHAVLPGAAKPVLFEYVAVLTAVLAVLVVVAWRRGPGRLAVVLLVVQLLVIVLAPSYFSFYAAFPAPALAVVAGSAVGPLPATGAVRRATLVVAGVLVVGVGVGVLRTGSGAPFPADRLRPAVASARCVTSDSPVTLALLDVLDRDLRRGCPVLVDVTGLTYDSAALPPRPDGHAVPRPQNPLWQRKVMRYLGSGEATVLVPSTSTRLSPASLRVVRSWPVLAESDRYRVLAPRG